MCVSISVGTSCRSTFCDCFFMIDILVSVSCVSTRFRVHMPDCVRKVVSENHFVFNNINFVTFPD